VVAFRFLCFLVVSFASLAIRPGKSTEHVSKWLALKLRPNQQHNGCTTHLVKLGFLIPNPGAQVLRKCFDALQCRTLGLDLVMAKVVAILNQSVHLRAVENHANH
jgi:hypothetical protein